MLLEDIKCIIWDLDDTLWEGSIAESPVSISESCKELIHAIDSCGVIQTVCSKNLFEPVSDFLKQEGLWEYFIAPMISYENKAVQIEAFCKKMHFRYENCLFIDDNTLNLREAEFYCKGIKTLEAFSENDFIGFYTNPEYSKNKTSRRPYYRLLEKKETSRSSTDSNRQFLHDSEIKISIRPVKSCYFERIYELIKRTNQLNYTKKRISRLELKKLLYETADVESYYISARDRYGDYGVIGFIALQDNALIHFLFSCRVLGMGIEQYTYRRFGCPSLSVQGDVAVQLDSDEVVDWIEETDDSDAVYEEECANTSEKALLLKGPCDIRSLFSYFAETDRVDTEFTYTNDNGIAIEQINHTWHVVQSLLVDKKALGEIAESLPFGDINMYSDKMFSDKGYKAVCYSVLTDSNLGVYRRKADGVYLAFGEYTYPLTDPEYREDYINGRIFTANCKFTKDFLEWFSDNFDFVGRISADQFRKNLKTIRENLDGDCHLTIITGVELPYENNVSKHYVGRENNHREFRKIAEEVAAEYKNTHIVSINEYVKEQSDFNEHYNHYQKRVYYNMAMDLIYLLRSFGIDDFNPIKY